MATKSKKSTARQATTEDEICQVCHGSGIITVTRHVRGKRPDSTNEGICLTCLGNGKAADS